MSDPAYHAADCWPDERQQLLLKACLTAGEEAIEAWAQWRLHGNFEDADDGSYRLFPLLYRNMRDHGLEMDMALRRFKGVYRLTWSQNNFLFHHSAAVLKSLLNADSGLMLLKGAPLALLYYRDPALRPMSDLDIMVRPQQRDKAIHLLLEAGYQPLEQLKPQRLQLTHSLGFKDRDGFSVDLHWYLIQEACQPDMQDVWWQRSQPLDFKGIEVRTLSDSDQLLHTLAHGGRWNPLPPLRWVADASMIIRDSEIDWELILQEARRLRLVVTVRECLGFMSTLLPGLVPGEVLERLQAIAVEAREAREFAVKANEFSYWKRILFHWYNYQRVTEPMPRGARPGFIHYLMLRWELENLWQLKDVVVSRVRRERLRAEQATARQSS